MSSNCLFCPTNSTKPKEIKITIMSDEEKQQILTFQKLETPNCDICTRKKFSTVNRFSELLQITFLSTDISIDSLTTCFRCNWFTLVVRWSLRPRWVQSCYLMVVAHTGCTELTEEVVKGLMLFMWEVALQHILTWQVIAGLRARWWCWYVGLYRKQRVWVFCHTPNATGVWCPLQRAREKEEGKRR